MSDVQLLWRNTRCHTLCYMLEFHWLSTLLGRETEHKSQQQSKCEPPRFLMSLPNFHVQVRKVTKNDGWTRRRKTEQNHSDLSIHTQTFFLHVSPPSHRCFDLLLFFCLPPGELAELPCSFTETSLEGWICFGDYAAALEAFNSKVPRMNPWVQHGSNL